MQIISIFVFTAVIFSASAQAEIMFVNSWLCGMVSSSATYTPDVELFPPAGSREPLGCSIKPKYEKFVRKTVKKLYGLDKSVPEMFNDQCVQHDLCYRHGSYTYGKDQDACDDEFKASMKQRCDELYFDEERNDDCKDLASHMTNLMSFFGKKYFRSSEKRNDTGLYCEYDPNDTGQYAELWALVKELEKSPMSSPQFELQQILLSFFARLIDEDELRLQLNDWLFSKPAATVDFELLRNVAESIKSIEEPSYL